MNAHIVDKHSSKRCRLSTGDKFHLDAPDNGEAFDFLNDFAKTLGYGLIRNPTDEYLDALIEDPEEVKRRLSIIVFF